MGGAVTCSGPQDVLVAVMCQGCPAQVAHLQWW